jgi:hypothetical protein
MYVWREVGGRASLDFANLVFWSTSLYPHDKILNSQRYFSKKNITAAKNTQKWKKYRT